jgi:hypothetical protein
MNQQEFKQKQVNARAQFTRHDHPITDQSPLTRENCGACVLAGYTPKGERRDYINYAGWARVYIQAGRFIPARLEYSFLAELANKNRAYADALKQDIKDFGISCRKPSHFSNAIKDILEIYE